jgi:hypothetical protein
MSEVKPGWSDSCVQSQRHLSVCHLLFYNKHLYTLNLFRLNSEQGKKKFKSCMIPCVMHIRLSWGINGWFEWKIICRRSSCNIFYEREGTDFFPCILMNLDWNAMLFEVTRKKGIFFCFGLITGARGSVIGWGTILQSRRSRDPIQMWWILSIYLILSAALWPWGRHSL